MDIFLPGEIPVMVLRYLAENKCEAAILALIEEMPLLKAHVPPKPAKVSNSDYLKYLARSLVNRGLKDVLSDYANSKILAEEILEGDGSSSPKFPSYDTLLNRMKTIQDLCKTKPSTSSVNTSPIATKYSSNSNSDSTTTDYQCPRFLLNQEKPGKEIGCQTEEVAFQDEIPVVICRSLLKNDDLQQKIAPDSNEHLQDHQGEKNDGVKKISSKASTEVDKYLAELLQDVSEDGSGAEIDDRGLPLDNGTSALSVSTEVESNPSAMFDDDDDSGEMSDSNSQTNIEPEQKKLITTTSAVSESNSKNVRSEGPSEPIPDFCDTELGNGNNSETKIPQSSSSNSVLPTAPLPQESSITRISSTSLAYNKVNPVFNTSVVIEKQTVHYGEKSANFSVVTMKNERPAWDKLRRKSITPRIPGFVPPRVTENFTVLIKGRKRRSKASSTTSSSSTVHVDVEVKGKASSRKPTTQHIDCYTQEQKEAKNIESTTKGETGKGKGSRKGAPPKNPKLTMNCKGIKGNVNDLFGNTPTTPSKNKRSPEAVAADAVPLGSPRRSPRKRPMMTKLLDKSPFYKPTSNFGFFPHCENSESSVKRLSVLPPQENTVFTIVPAPLGFRPEPTPIKNFMETGCLNFSNIGFDNSLITPLKSNPVPSPLPLTPRVIVDQDSNSNSTHSWKLMYDGLYPSNLLMSTPLKSGIPRTPGKESSSSNSYSPILKTTESELQTSQPPSCQVRQSRTAPKQVEPPQPSSSQYFPSLVRPPQPQFSAPPSRFNNGFFPSSNTTTNQQHPNSVTTSAALNLSSARLADTLDGELSSNDEKQEKTTTIGSITSTTLEKQEEKVLSLPHQPSTCMSPASTTQIVHPEEQQQQQHSRPYNPQIPPTCVSSNRSHNESINVQLAEYGKSLMLTDEMLLNSIALVRMGSSVEKPEGVKQNATTQQNPEANAVVQTPNTEADVHKLLQNTAIDNLINLVRRKHAPKPLNLTNLQ